MRFHKYQALGNDYIVVETSFDQGLPSELIRRICHRNLGIGSDGILIGKFEQGGFALRIFNPDGSEAEKSGNGLRIYARFLWDCGQVKNAPFKVRTRGGMVSCEVRDGGRRIFVEMGRANFDSETIPVKGPKRDVINERIEIDGQAFQFTALTVGNPHCVIHCDAISSDLAHRVGPKIEAHALFPNRTNVQFVKVIDPHHIRIEIWERGAGYTLASGSSSCAAAAASVMLGFCSGKVDVSMPGGTIEIDVGADMTLTMLGDVEKVAQGELSKELLAHVD